MAKKNTKIQKKVHRKISTLKKDRYKKDNQIISLENKIKKLQETLDIACYQCNKLENFIRSKGVSRKEIESIKH
jgi:hypothetical protein